MPISTLPRRAVLGAVLATSLIGTGLLAFAEETPAGGGCPSWTDPKGDASFGEEGLPETGDNNLDIVAASLSTVGDAVVGKITSAALGQANSDAGDEFRITFKIGGATVQLYADRANGVFGSKAPAAISNGYAGFYNETASKSGAATVAYDVKANTVTMTGKIAELTKALGKPAAGLPMTDIVATTHNLVGSPDDGLALTPVQYDNAPTKLTYVVGANCDGGGAAPAATPSASASPSPSASPAPSPSASPSPSGTAPAAAGQPTPGCNTFADPKGDASIVLQPGAPGTPNDADLDITGLVLQSTTDEFRAYLRVDKLATRPQGAPGHSFYVNFTLNKKAVNLIGTAYDPAAIKDAIDAVSAGTAGTPAQRSPGTRMLVDGTYTPSSLKAVFDTKASMVTLSIKRADLDKVAGEGGFADGTVLKKVFARSLMATPVVGLFVDSTAKDNSVGVTDAEAWTVGDNACFAPPVPPLSSVGAIKAQYGDLAPVAAKLVDSGGAPVSGKQVTFTLGRSKVTGTTGADGVAKASLPVKEKAGKRALTIAAEGASVTVDFTVSVEKTLLRATGAKGSVTATLIDDDRKPVAGQVVTFTAGKKKVSARTNAKGQARATGLPPGSVKVTYAGAAGMYSASSTSTRA